MFFFFLTTVCVKLLGLYLPLYMFCCMRASVSGLMALLVLWFFPLNIFIHSFVRAVLYGVDTDSVTNALRCCAFEMTVLN